MIWIKFHTKFSPTYVIRGTASYMKISELKVVLYIGD